MPTCNKCGKEKDVEMFSIDQATLSGRRNECKECANKRRRDSKEGRRLKDKQAALEQAAREQERREKLNIAGPRTYVTTDVWVPVDNSFYRNNGNKHIQSRGF